MDVHVAGSSATNRFTTTVTATIAMIIPVEKTPVDIFLELMLQRRF